MLIPVIKNVFRWTSNDPELGIEQVGHLIISENSVVAIDPPLVPGLADAIKVLGNPAGIILTNYEHSRGGAFLSRILDVPILIPEVRDTATMKVSEKIKIHRLDSGKKFDESAKLPCGLKAHYIRGETKDGRVMANEMALQYENTLILGDTAWGIHGEINVFPHGIMPDPDGVLEEANRQALKSIISKTKSSNLLSGHGDPIIGSLQNKI
jgi:hypothetical protein